MAGTPAEASPKPKGPFLSRLGDRAGDLAIEFVGTIITIVGIALTDLGVKWLIGADKKFFDALPVGWVFDACHLLVIGRFMWRFLWGREGT